ncbi:aminotransferase class I/II-fold pyridoxal phosphate-dependent enzyme [Bacillus sp. NEB1478]|uniref:aminotransferase class I/II-fold pyridoxal phosphate-dependent enzyme n=1 Tax=Bacillus sp. NEB1478 TaxID=3073816 RepID=UPI00287317CA|nr:aminotransferase class I/II-fold pyridoxal phosphate-dependent enzyme [Bacillus sp. NEB1478]WNB92056.1 aminotransferase class I/II-fold pyridoxal phosphate-dependent enzyme [Bacillus sp. NEB1478]
MKNAPLFEALVHHTKKNKWSFHVPGHKNGKIFEKSGAAFFKTVLPLDATELTGLDDLHHPEGVIKEAQELLASFYEVNKSYLLVGGSTSGNLAMILSSFEQGDVVFVQRNSHKSVLNGLELAGVTPVFLSPEMDVEGGYPLGITIDTVNDALTKFPESKGIILTNPTYYGLQQDITGIADAIHGHGGIVLVDEAHGAHFGLKDMPKMAIQQGADAAVQSAHKTLPALTMGAFLHVNSDRIDEYRLSHALQMVQSSSPSYLLMASLDLSRLYLENLSEEDVTSIINQSQTFKEFIDSLPHLQVVKNPKGYVTDPLKVTIQSDREISGYKLQSLFEKEGIYPELADERNVLLVLPLGMMDSLSELKKVFYILADQLKVYKNKESVENIPTAFPSVSMLELTYTQMKKLRAKKILIEDAAGYIAAIAVIPYPPGIPLIVKGEKITSESIRLYFSLKEKGAKFQGTTEKQEMYVFDIN